MALYLCTGTPGAGKTLNTLKMVYERAQKEERPVYYAGVELIRDNRVGIDFSNWYEMADPKTADLEAEITPFSWQNAPDGAIILIDECHKYYPPMGVSAKLPEYIVDFAEHRHRGFDIYLISQGPARVNAAIKDWVQPHIHFRKIWGGNTVWRYDNEQCVNDIRNTRAIAEAAIKSRVRLDRRWFKAYVSASLHTKNTRVPTKLIILMALPFFLLPGSLWYLYNYYKNAAESEQGKMEAPVGKPVQNTAIPSVAPEENGRLAPDRQFDPVTAYAPRIETMPETAPAYDELRKPRDFPRPQCMESKKRGCQCYSQQGTLLKDYPRDLCRSYVKQGYFDPTRPRVGARSDKASVLDKE